MKNKNNLQILFFGFVIPPDLMEEVAVNDPFPQSAANKLQWRFLHGLRDNGVEDIEICSSLPVYDYPRSPYLFIKKRKFAYDGYGGVIFPYINVIAFKHLSRFVMASWYLLKWVYKNRGSKNEKRILLYGLNSSYLYSLLLVKLFSKVKVINIITDIPIDESSREPFMRGLLRKVDRYLLWFAMKRMDASVILTSLIGKDYIPNLKTLVIEGMIDPNMNDLNSYEKPDLNVPQNLIVYTGAISESYGINHLINVFNQLDATYNLWIFGKGDYVDVLQDQIIGKENIKYWGFVKDNKFVQYASSLAKVLIIPRNPINDVTKYCFPSKLLEYMVSGVPVITSRMDGIPLEYEDYVYMVESSGDFDQNLYNKIVEICGKSDEELSTMALNAKKFVFENKSPNFQTRKLINFIKNV